MNRTIKPENKNPTQDPRLSTGPAEEGIRINGLEQVVAMLEHADPQFRESLLKRLGAKDPKLAQNLRRIVR